MRAVAGQFLRFCVVGGLGFGADAGILLALLRWTALGPYFGRIVSYLVAATLTWVLNRRFTFAATAGARPHREWVRYVLVNGLGGGLNYLVYVLCIRQSALFWQHPAWAVAAGSAVALIFNFTANKFVVFRR